MNPKLLNTAARRLAGLARSDQFSGTVLIRQGQNDLLHRSYGLAHRGFRIRNRRETRYRIASVGKMFTAAAVLRQVDAGLLTLDTPVVAALGLQGTRLPPQAAVRHYLGMTSGIADWIDEDAEDFEALWAQFCREHPLYLIRTNADVLPLFSQLEPLFPPGERYRYNGAGYVLLGLLLEKVTGAPYFELIEQEIFAPAGMSRTGFPCLDDLNPDTAEGYLSGKDGAWRKNVYAATAGAAADGGATSTADDLANFFQALRAGRLCSPAQVEAMRSPGALIDAEALAPARLMYGYGCILLTGEDGQIIRWGHTGEEEGISCRLFHFPAADADLVILGNQSACAGPILRLFTPALAEKDN